MFPNARLSEAATSPQAVFMVKKAPKTKSSKPLVYVDDTDHWECRASVRGLFLKELLEQRRAGIFNHMRTKVWLASSIKHCKAGLRNPSTNLEAEDFSGALWRVKINRCLVAQTVTRVSSRKRLAVR